jgi:hypothetical protein
MENKSYMILGVGIALVVIVIVAMFVFAGDLTGGTETNLTSKVYDSVTKTVTIVDSKNEATNIAKVQLKTPLTVIVPVGYQKVAEFEITSYKNYTSAFEKMEFYNVNNKMAAIEAKQFDYKVKTNLSYDVNDYEEKPTCEIDPKNLTDTCYYKIIGTHKVYYEDWVPLAKADFIEGKVYTISIWTQVNMYDNVEWIPTMFGGIRIEEWANYVQSSGTKTYVDIGGVNYTVWTFTSNGTFNSTAANLNVSVLVIGGGAGGGGGGDYLGSGGGAGGYIYNNAFTIASGNYIVSVGAGGGAGVGHTHGGNGTNTSFSTLVAWGGGGGGVNTGTDLRWGWDGGSGGGMINGGGAGRGIAGQGNNGGRFAGSNCQGAGGGAGEIGGNCTGTAGPKGGDGLSFTIYNGTALWYGGGGGGSGNTASGPGGKGGGGLGAKESDGNAGSGVAGTGGGGGGGNGAFGTPQEDGGAGGSGIVIIRYLTSDDVVGASCNFSGYVKDGGGLALSGANVNVVNQANYSENYTATSSASGYWTVNITNSTKTFLAYTYFNNSLAGGIKPYISGQC